MRHPRARIAAVFATALTVGFLITWATPIESWTLRTIGALSVALLSLPAWWARYLLFLPLFTRLARQDLAEHEVRAKILNALRAEPGLGITDLCARLGIGWGTAVHHLTRLEGAGLLTSQDAGRRRRFFLPDESPSRRTAVCVLSSEMNRRLLEYVRAHPGRSQTEVCAALGISAPLAHKYLARLIGEGLVTTVRQWRTVQYYPGEHLAAALNAYAQLQGAPREEGLIHPA